MLMALPQLCMCGILFRSLIRHRTFLLRWLLTQIASRTLTCCVRGRGCGACVMSLALTLWVMYLMETRSFVRLTSCCNKICTGQQGQRLITSMLTTTSFKLGCRLFPIVGIMVTSKRGTLCVVCKTFFM